MRHSLPGPQLLYLHGLHVWDRAWLVHVKDRELAYCVRAGEQYRAVPTVKVNIWVLWPGVGATLMAGFTRLYTLKQVPYLVLRLEK